MKKIMMALVAASLFVSAVPAFSATHGGSHDPADVQCAQDCEMLLRNCSQEVQSIQEKIRGLETAIEQEGANPQKRDNLAALNKKLAEAKAILAELERPGR
jgi:peptidoglycan hydrolase CwlO-like protein